MSTNAELRSSPSGGLMVVQLLTFLVPIVLFSACSSPYELRRKELVEGLEPGDDVTVYQPANRTENQGTSFEQLRSKDRLKISRFLVTSFPGAQRTLQRHLVSIMKGRPAEVRVPEKLLSQIPVPYRYPPEKQNVILDVRESERTIDPDKGRSGTSEEPPEGFFISGSIRKAVVGVGAPVEEHTSAFLPEDHVFFRVETTWRYGRTDGENHPETVRIEDEALVNYASYPDPYERIYSVERTFNQLLKRVAWRVASRILPHQYDTSFKPFGEK